MTQAAAFPRSAKRSIALSVFLVVLGLLAMAAPFFAGIAVSLLLSWLIVTAGVTHLFYAWSERAAAVVVWQVLIGLAYAIAGFYLMVHPLLGMVALTFVLALYIAVEGVLELVVFSRLRHSGAAVFFLIDGVLSILLAALIFFHWPSGSKWIIGTLLGVSILMSGIVRLALPVRWRALSRRNLFGQRFVARPRLRETPPVRPTREES